MMTSSNGNIFCVTGHLQSSQNHVSFVRRRIQMSDVEFVKIISIWCLSVQFGRRSMKSIREDWFVWEFPITSEFPTHRPVTRSFDVFFDLRLNKRLSKQLWGWWFETPSCPSWRHCNARTVGVAERTGGITDRQTTERRTGKVNPISWISYPT